VFGVHLDRLDDQVQFVRTADRSRHAVVLAWRDLLGFSEVVQAVDPVGGVVLHEEHGTGSVFCPREQQQMVGAEVEHGSRTGRTRDPDQRAGVMSSRPRR
jgi:hypothetical protein